MKLKIYGNLNKYYIQTLCMLFCPGAKFADRDDEEQPDGQGLEALFICDSVKGAFGEYVFVTCKFVRNGQIGLSVKRERVGEGSVWLGVGEGASTLYDRACKMAAGKAALDAGRQLFGIIPSWGVLTGIRPANIAGEILRAPRREDPSKTNTTAMARSILINELSLAPGKASLVVDIARSEQRIERMLRATKARTCSVYVSIPFCPSRCAYCSFVSYTSRKLLALIPDYLARLIEDIQDTFAYLRSRGFRVTTVYIGGGTPTTLDEKQLELLLSAITSAADMSRLTEFTLEAGRPDTVTAEKLELARTFGVTRMSINPQTMNDEILKGIGRRHSVSDFYRAYTLAKNSGIRVINTDLIAGLPGDDYEGFSKTVDKMIALDPENITVHTFCVKKSAEILRVDTEIYNRSADETVKSVNYSQLRLKNSGYRPYYIYRQKNTVGNLENVGFAKKGTEGLYNVLMMEELHPIFAVGAGAVTKFVKRDANGKKQIKRIFEPKYPYEYLAADRSGKISAKLAEADKFFDFPS